MTVCDNSAVGYLGHSRLFSPNSYLFLWSWSTIRIPTVTRSEQYVHSVWKGGIGPRLGSNSPSMPTLAFFRSLARKIRKTIDNSDLSIRALRAKSILYTFYVGPEPSLSSTFKLMLYDGISLRADPQYKLPVIHRYNCVNNLHDSENLSLLKTVSWVEIWWRGT